MTDCLSSALFGYLPTGEAVEAWTLHGRGGVVLEVLNYGGIIRRLLVPDRNGKRADVVLGFSDPSPYLDGHLYFGAIIGRVAGRITGAQFCLGGSIYELAVNDSPNHLHGGLDGFDKKIWKATPTVSPSGEPSLRLYHHSPDGDEGYPGAVNVTVKYTVTNDNVFLIETEAISDSSTPLNLTHHSYLNLAGEAHASIADHELQIYADQFVVTDVRMTLLGRAESVSGCANDFRRLRFLRDALPFLFRNHGDLYVIRRSPEESENCTLIPAARLVHPDSGRILDVSTTTTHLQVYMGAGLDGSLIGKSGAPYHKHAGICLECQGYPDGANAPNLGDITLRPSQPQRHVTAYAFSNALTASDSSRPLAEKRLL